MKSVKKSSSVKIYSHNYLKNEDSKKALRLLVRNSKKLLLEFLNTQKIAQVNLEIYLCGDSKMRGLKRNFFGIDQSTDVLSFPKLPIEHWKSFSMDLPLGSLYINFPMAKRVAKELKLSEAEVLLCYLVHGFTHLVGYDHEENPKKFFSKEKKNLKILNLTVSLQDLAGYLDTHHGRNL